jgi:hypothetical protein
MTVATYQVGVDVLGFPIYVEHHIYRGEAIVNKFKPLKSFWVTVYERIIKQR